MAQESTLDGSRHCGGAFGGSMRYRVVIHESEEGFAVACPGLPGCWSQGATEAEALDNIRSAIEEYLEAVATLTAGAEVREVEVAVS
jgi:predicted RNase H-like HicB family nuclease